MDKITEEKLKKYFKITKLAFEKASKAEEKVKIENSRADSLDMIDMYIRDAFYFYEKKDFVNAFAALNYAHGWLDAGARIGLWKVKDNKLFVVDGE